MKTVRDGSRKASPILKVAFTPKAKKEKKETLGKGEKETQTRRKLVSNGPKSSNSSPDADAPKVSFIFYYHFIFFQTIMHIFPQDNTSTKHASSFKNPIPQTTNSLSIHLNPIKEIS